MSNEQVSRSNSSKIVIHIFLRRGHGMKGRDKGGFKVRRRGDDYILLPKRVHAPGPCVVKVFVYKVCIYRSRTQLVIYYDLFVQRAMTSLIRYVGKSSAVSHSPTSEQLTVPIRVALDSLSFFN